MKDRSEKEPTRFDAADTPGEKRETMMKPSCANAACSWIFRSLPPSRVWI
jgi:hypothetical protein